VSYVRTWTFVVSEYLDLPFVLRHAGQPVVSARSAEEALDVLRHCKPARIIVDECCLGADSVVSYALSMYPSAAIEYQHDVIQTLLAG
jgi:hypothetical protein